MLKYVKKKYSKFPSFSGGGKISKAHSSVKQFTLILVDGEKKEENIKAARTVERSMCIELDESSSLRFRWKKKQNFKTAQLKGRKSEEEKFSLVVWELLRPFLLLFLRTRNILFERKYEIRKKERKM